MILSAQTIRRLCMPINTLHKPLIEPFVERGVFDGKSYGLSACSYDCRLAQDVILWRCESFLASTIERFCLPKGICGMVLDKSSHARRGISAFNTFLDPGWKGWLTIELVNFGVDHVKLVAGTPICQVVFMKLDQESEQPYQGKYQDQPNEPVGALRERSE